MDNMKLSKGNYNIETLNDTEVYCLRDMFYYDCKNTPHNCTECPVMRFMYHDLINRILDKPSANKLKELIEENKVFAGKYDGAKNLPQNVWSAIYNIRRAYSRADGGDDSEQRKQGFTTPEIRSRFRQWFAQNGVYKGAMTAGDAVVKIANETICDGNWILVSPSGDLVLQEESGLLLPICDSDAAPLIEKAVHLIRNDIKNDDTLTSFSIRPHVSIECGIEDYEPLSYIRVSAEIEFAHTNNLRWERLSLEAQSEIENSLWAKTYAIKKIGCFSCQKNANQYQGQYLRQILKDTPDIRIRIK